jgi:PhoH-like ATPase
VARAGSTSTTAKTKSETAAKKKPDVATKTYVLDTSVLLSDPRALFKFKEQEVVIPIIVINELEKKRHDPEIGYYARQALRNLDDLRAEHERLDFPIQVGDGGTLRVELNHVDQSVLPAGLQLGDNDSRILACAFNLASEGLDVTVVSKDLPMRVKAASLGMNAEEYRNDMAADSGWTGIAEITLSGDEVNDLYDTEVIKHKDVASLPINTGLVIHSERGSALGRVEVGSKIKLVHADRDLFGVHGRSAEQRLAIDLLLDPEIGIISMGGRAGTGKSALALCAGLEAVLERRQHKKIMVFRPLFAVGGQELGYLPGTEAEKMNPWGQAIFDTLGPLVSKEVIDHVVDRGILEVLPLTHIRGRSLHDAFVIVDEAQSLERNTLLTMLSRIGQNSRVVLTHDVAQRDNLRVGRHDGIASVVEQLKNNKLFAHVTLTRSERSAIAGLVTDLLDN